MSRNNKESEVTLNNIETKISVSTFSQDVMERTRNKTRIRVANIMMALTAIACLVMVFSGKQAAERGESVQKMNQDWHKEYNEKSIAEAQAAKASQKNK